MQQASNGLVDGAITPHSGLSGKARPRKRWLPRLLVPKASEWSGDGAAGKD
jgi:hypothetical protein